jgi:glycosyltransferase involved in cell wall biosynthesis
MNHHHKRRRRVLFILKKASYNYGSGYNVLSSGLAQSVNFCSEELTNAGIENKSVIVVDNNDIDREVTQYHPTDVIIEALWVVPEKFDVLKRLHPSVRWLVHIHSELPFLAMEGVAMRWILGYLDRDVSIATNSLRMLRDLRSITDPDEEDLLLYLPNCYTEFPEHNERHTRDEEVVNVACFGAIRPLKNQLTQAVAAIEFAQQVDRRLHFHINTGRVEQNGESTLRNLIDLFNGLDPDQFRLVRHPWHSRSEFLRTLRKIDIGLQVSLTETFNITAADMVSRDVPVVVSPEISWVSPLFQAEATSTADIVAKMKFAWRWRHWGMHDFNKHRLRKFAHESARIWVDEFADLD